MKNYIVKFTFSWLAEGLEVRVKAESAMVALYRAERLVGELEKLNPDDATMVHIEMCG